MRRALALFLAMGAALGCFSTQRDACKLRVEFVQEISGAADATLLAETAERFLDAHCRCRFDPELKKLVTFGKTTMSPDEVIRREQCLGPLDPVAWRLETPEFGSLEVEERVGSSGAAKRIFVMAFVYQGGRWLFYWPEPEQQSL